MMAAKSEENAMLRCCSEISQRPDLCQQQQQQQQLTTTSLLRQSRWWWWDARSCSSCGRGVSLLLHLLRSASLLWGKYKNTYKATPSTTTTSAAAASLAASTHAPTTCCSCCCCGGSCCCCCSIFQKLPYWINDWLACFDGRLNWPASRSTR